jgi:hypothetical protein
MYKRRKDESDNWGKKFSENMITKSFRFVSLSPEVRCRDDFRQAYAYEIINKGDFIMEEKKKNIKISEEDIKMIQNLRLSFQNLSLQLGQIVLQLKNLEKQKEALLNEYDNLQKNEREIADTFVKKYGEGQLNPNTWEFEKSEK